MRFYLFLIGMGLLVSCSSLHNVRPNGIDPLAGVWFLDSMVVDDSAQYLYAESFTYLREDGRYAGYAATLLDQFEISRLGKWDYRNDTLWIHNGSSGNFFLVEMQGADTLTLRTVSNTPMGSVRKDSYFTRVYGTTQALDNDIEYFENRETEQWHVID